MSAIPARPSWSKRLARAIGLDGNPLRRTTDRVLAWIRVGAIAAFLTAGPLAAIGAGSWIYHAARTEARVQARDRHGVQAVLLQRTPAPLFAMGTTHWGGDAWVRAAWVGSGSVLRTGEVFAPAGLAAGSVVTVWLDASGKLTQPPLPPAQIADRVAATAVAVPVILALSLMTALWIARRVADRRRIAAWDHAWSTVGPEWTRRG